MSRTAHYGKVVASNVIRFPDRPKPLSRFPTSEDMQAAKPFHAMTDGERKFLISIMIREIAVMMENPDCPLLERNR